MQRTRPVPTCDCVAETARIIHRIQRAATCNGSGLPESTSTTTAALDDVLGEGRALVRSWERMNGCANAAAHVDGDHATLRAMIGAVDRLVGLYETLGRAAHLFFAGARTPATAAGVVENPPSTQQQQPPAVYLGTLRLDDEEAVLVAREAVRHSVILLGELLHDIERDLGEELEESSSQGRSPSHDAEAMAATFEEVSKVSATLLRLLGRINSSAERA